MMNGRFRKLGALPYTTTSWTPVEITRRLQTKAAANPAVQRTGASRFAQRRIQRQRRLAPVADLFVRQTAATGNISHEMQYLRLGRGYCPSYRNGGGEVLND